MKQEADILKEFDEKFLSKDSLSSVSQFNDEVSDQITAIKCNLTT